MIHFLCIAQGVTEMSFRLRSFSFSYSLLRKIMEFHSLKLPVSPKLLFHIRIIIFLVHHVPSNLLYYYFWLSMSQNYQTAEALSRLFGYAVIQHGTWKLSHWNQPSHLVFCSEHSCHASGAGPSNCLPGHSCTEGEISFWLRPMIFLCPEAWGLIFCTSSLLRITARIFIFMYVPNP